MDEGSWSRYRKLDSPVSLRKLVYIPSLDYLPLITSSGRSGLKRFSSSSSFTFEEFGMMGRIGRIGWGGKAVDGTCNKR